MADRTCVIDGCGKAPRSPTADLCPMHYHRRYRHGDPHKTARRISVGQQRRYRMVYQPTHPLAGANGKVYEHRAVLYEEIGPGPHSCHWCAAEVDWLPRGTPGELHVDHLNGAGDDNHPSNLVPSCPRCNQLRGIQRRSAVLRTAGWWSAHDTVERLGPRAAPVAPDSALDSPHERNDCSIDEAVN